MVSKYQIDSHKTSEYISILTNQVFSILPTFEESGVSDTLTSKIENVTRKIDGFLSLNEDVFDYTASVDILVHLYSLKKIESHGELRSCVLKICSLLSSLKGGDGIGA